MTQMKLSKVTFRVDGLYTAGHARRCEAMVRNAGGGIDSVRANEISGIVEIVFDVRMQNPHSLRDIVDDTGYTVIG